MDRVMAWLVKLLFIVMLAPFVICLVLQLVVGVAVAILPWVILGSVLAGLVAGVSAALVLRRRLPPFGGAGLPPGAPPFGPHRVRRPRSSDWR